MNDMTASAVVRLEHEADALSQLATALTSIHEAQLHVAHADLPSDTLGGAVMAHADLLEQTIKAVRERVRTRAGQIGWQVATYEIAPVAKVSSEPIAWLTSNAYMPPMRDIDACEHVWQADTGDLELFALMVEAIEQRLEALRVYLGAPEYDNALYVVDLERFEFVDEPDDADTLDAQFRAISE